VFLLAALYSIPLLVALRPIAVPVIDPDLWWHLRVGQWVVEHRAVPTHDPFSQPGLHTHWVAYSWLYEILLYGLYQAFGLAGIIVYRVILALAIVAALHRLVSRRQPRFLIAILLCAAACLALAPLFSERPWLFTILFTALTLDVVLDLRTGQRCRLAWALPVLYVLWASIHIQFVYGLFVLALACACPLIERAFPFLPRQEASDETASTAGTRAWWRFVALALACFLATFLNPYHVRLYGVILEYSTQHGPFRFVNELKALEFREPSDWVVLGLTGTALFFLGRRSSCSLFDLALVASTAFFAFRARRDLWFVVLADLAVLACFAPRRDAVGSRGHGVSSLTLRVGVSSLTLRVGVGLLVVVVGCFTVWRRDLSSSNLRGQVASVFPVQAAEVVAQRGYPGPLYNDFNWGGYLIWSLPHLPVAIDGRTNLHGDERILRFGNTWAGGPGWQDDPDLRAARVIIAQADSPLAALLRFDGRFVLVHEDPVARVFVARSVP
jgi:hypothetical protein